MPGGRGVVEGGFERGRDRGRHPVSKANFADNKSRLQTGKEDAESGDKKANGGSLNFTLSILIASTTPLF